MIMQGHIKCGRTHNEVGNALGLIGYGPAASQNGAKLCVVHCGGGKIMQVAADNMQRAENNGAVMGMNNCSGMLGGGDILLTSDGWVQRYVFRKFQWHNTGHQIRSVKMTTLMGGIFPAVTVCYSIDKKIVIFLQLYFLGLGMYLYQGVGVYKLIVCSTREMPYTRYTTSCW